MPAHLHRDLTLHDIEPLVLIVMHVPGRTKKPLVRACEFNEQTPFQEKRFLGTPKAIHTGE